MMQKTKESSIKAMNRIKIKLKLILQPQVIKKYIPKKIRTKSPTFQSKSNGNNKYI